MIVERSTVEQQPFAKERNNLKQKLLAASAISACVASLYTFSHRSIEVSQICSENNIFSDYSMDISSSIKYDPTTGEHKTTKGEVSPSRIENLTSDLLFAINDPIMQLAIKNKSVDGITINLAQNSEMYHITEFGIYDDDANCGTNKEILLGVSSTEPNEQLGSPTNRFCTSLIIIHEAIHGLNHEWWRKIERTKVFDSPLDPKLYKLQNKCIAIYQWTTHKKKRGEIARGHSGDESIANACSSASLAYYQRDNELYEAFQCVNEGDMLQSQYQLYRAPNIGHPWDNATELASSAMNVVWFNPDYLISCLNSQDRLEATLIKEYVQAAFELSLAYNPELEDILRQKPRTAQALDFLLSA